MIENEIYSNPIPPTNKLSKEELKILNENKIDFINSLTNADE